MSNSISLLSCSAAFVYYCNYIHALKYGSVSQPASDCKLDFANDENGLDLLSVKFGNSNLGVFGEPEALRLKFIIEKLKENAVRFNVGLIVILGKPDKCGNQSSFACQIESMRVDFGPTCIATIQYSYAPISTTGMLSLSPSNMRGLPFRSVSLGSGM